MREDVQAMTDEAIAFIQEHEPPEGYYVGFSGGKDSIVLLDLMRRAGVKYKAYYNMTLIDPPELVRFIRKHYPEVIMLKPDITFWKGISKKGILPTRLKRWCCDVLKKGTKSSRAIPLKHRVMGLRIQESTKRASRPRVDYFSKLNQYMYKPIFNWQTWQIWDYIKNNKLPYPSLYDEGWSRLGCVVCPYVDNPKTVLRNRERWPQFYRILDKHMNQLWTDKSDVFIKMGFTYDEFMKWPCWKPSKVVRYLKVQQNLFKGDGDATS